MRAILVYQNTILHIMLIKTHQDNYSSCGVRTGRAFLSSLHEHETLSGVPQSDFGFTVGKFFILSELWCRNDTLVSAAFFCFPEFACWLTLPWLSAERGENALGLICTTHPCVGLGRWAAPAIPWCADGHCGFPLDARC